MPDVTNRHREPNGQFADENRNTALFNEQNVNTLAKLDAVRTDIEHGEYDNEIRTDLMNLGVDPDKGMFASHDGWQAIRNYYSGQVEGYATYSSVSDFEQGAEDRLSAKEIAQLAESDAVTSNGNRLCVTKDFTDRYVRGDLPYEPEITIDNYGDVYNHHDYPHTEQGLKQDFADSRLISQRIRAGAEAENASKNHTYVTADGVITDAGSTQLVGDSADHTFYGDQDRCPYGEYSHRPDCLFIKNKWVAPYADTPIDDNTRVYIDARGNGDGATFIFARLGRGYEPLPAKERENYINALNRAISVDKTGGNK